MLGVDDTHPISCSGECGAFGMHCCCLTSKGDLSCQSNQASQYPGVRTVNTPGYAHTNTPGATHTPICLRAHKHTKVQWFREGQTHAYVCVSFGMHANKIRIFSPGHTQPAHARTPPHPPARLPSTYPIPSTRSPSRRSVVNPQRARNVGRHRPTCSPCRASHFGSG